jgi:SAM-dependent methyltransferase
MEEEQLRTVAAQLRKPHGDYALQIAKKMNEGNFHINTLAIKQLDLQDNDVVLEIGMGNGYFAKDIVTRGKGVRYIGCDFSQEMVKCASDLNDELVRTGIVSFHCADAATLPLANGSVSKILTVNTIYFWSEPQKILQELHRVLIPGGKLIIGIRPKTSMEVYPFVKYGFTMYTKDEVVDVLTSNYFDLGAIEEQEEPDQEIAGEKYKVESLVVSVLKK